MKNFPIVLLLLIGLNACTWVKPTETGAKVVLAEPFNVTHCTNLGNTTASVKHNVGSIERNQEKVTSELVTLAKNQAAAMGGDSIVAQGPVKDGAMVFAIYRCSN